MLLALLTAACNARMETYLEHLHRVANVHTDSEVAIALQDSDDPVITMSMLQPLAKANIAFLDGLMATQLAEPASSSASVFLPLR